MNTNLKKLKQRNKGFTLMETLVYIALYSIIMGGTVVAVYTIFESMGRNQTKAMIEEEGTFLAGKIGWVLSSGIESINVPVLGATDPTLQVKRYAKYDGTIITISVPDPVEGVMTIQSGATSTPLNNANTKVSGLLFTAEGVSSDGISPGGITASFTLSGLTPNGMAYSQNFSVTRYLRK